jgi:hypothetical protein
MITKFERSPASGSLRMRLHAGPFPRLDLTYEAKMLCNSMTIEKPRHAKPSRKSEALKRPVVSPPTHPLQLRSDFQSSIACLIGTEVIPHLSQSQWIPIDAPSCNPAIPQIFSQASSCTPSPPNRSAIFIPSLLGVLFDWK